MNRRRGLTLIELLVSISIIAIVFAIITPVFHYVRERGKITSALSYMHQIGKAVAIYRADWESGGGYSSPSALGLPTAEYLYRTNLGLSSRVLQSPCGYRGIKGLETLVPLANYKWALYGDTSNAGRLAGLRKYEERTLVVFDPWCNPAGTNWSNPYEEKRAIGLMLGGQVVNRRGPGQPDFQPFWGPPPQ